MAMDDAAGALLKYSSAAQQFRKDELISSFKQVQADIDQASSPISQPVRLVAVSKFKPSSDILAIYENLGHLHFGENYVGELENKMKTLPMELKWHFIGALQSNKCKILGGMPNLFAIETVDSKKKAELLEKSRQSLFTKQSNIQPIEIYLQVNISNEPNKAGFLVDPHGEGRGEDGPNDTEDSMYQTARYIVEVCTWLRLKGLMTIGSLEKSKAAQNSSFNPDFQKLIDIRDQLSHRLNGYSMGLSMGMSEDFVLAIKMGSDNVRVGSKIFGARPPKETVEVA